MEGVTVVVADSQHLFAESMARTISRRPGWTVADYRSRTGLQAVEAFDRHVPELLVLDYWLAEMNGPAAARQILARRPDAKILLLGWLYGPLQVQEARVSGARCFLPKTCGVEELVQAMAKVLEGWSVFPGGTGMGPLEMTEPLAVERLGDRDALTARETQVLQMFCDGHSRHEVTTQLGIRPGTLKNHIHNILTKTGAESLVEAVASARNEGLVRESGRTGRDLRRPSGT